MSFSRTCVLIRDVQQFLLNINSRCSGVFREHRELIRRSGGVFRHISEVFAGILGHAFGAFGVQEGIRSGDRMSPLPRIRRVSFVRF